MKKKYMIKLVFVSMSFFMMIVSKTYAYNSVCFAYADKQNNHKASMQLFYQNKMTGTPSFVEFKFVFSAKKYACRINNFFLSGSCPNVANTGKIMFYIDERFNQYIVHWIQVEGNRQVQRGNMVLSKASIDTCKN